MYLYEESKLRYGFAWPKDKPNNSNPPPAFELVKIQLICKVEHMWHDLSGKNHTKDGSENSTYVTMKSQDFNDPEKTCRAILIQLQSLQFPLFECKVIVDELIQLAQKYSNCSVLVDGHQVLKLGIKLNMSNKFRQIKEEDSNIIVGKDSSIGNCKICRENIFGGSSVTKMPCSHMFHFNCIKSWLEKNIGCPSCSHQQANGISRTRSI